MHGAELNSLIVISNLKPHLFYNVMMFLGLTRVLLLQSLHPAIC